MSVLEVNFDGLPGPTHSYSGLSDGAEDWLAGGCETAGAAKGDGAGVGLGAGSGAAVDDDCA